jgi:quercetin dioxygenase-like cupin family protein
MTIPSHVGVAGIVLSGILLGQVAPSVNEDPSHKRLLFTAHLRMFDVTVAPGSSTLDHSHDHDLVTVAVGQATLRTRPSGGDWSDPRPVASGAVDLASYTGASAVHRIENVGTTPYRAFAIENLRDAKWTTPQLITAPGTTLLEQSRSFAVYDVRLDGSAPKTSHVHQMPTVVMLMAGTVEVQGGGGESVFRLETPGRWILSQWDQPHTLTLVGGGETHIVEVEAR